MTRVTALKVYQYVGNIPHWKAKSWGDSQESAVDGKANDGVVLVAPSDVHDNVKSEGAEGTCQLQDMGAEHHERRQILGHCLSDFEDVDP